ncbi:MAG: antibiotic biosynthesis monooxygenase family protein [Pseudomonadota bacterium]
MVVIDAEAEIFTLVNVFTVAKGRQDALIDLLSSATDDVISRQPGFLSASFHAGDDGRTVINYAQWERRADWEAMLTVPTAEAHIAEVQAMIESFQSTPCRVRVSHAA